ncbi:MAG TPA: acyltransferase [Phycisphaerae bacterium]|nr:acyltransferase [Phycisphaerae bacterium]
MGTKRQSGYEKQTPSTDPLHLGRKIIPELDGLRGLAILLVLVLHFSHFWPQDTRFSIYLGRTLSTCGSGVQLFFVLSGFLITGILLDSKGTAPRYFRNFYMRRFLRIFPIYYAAIGLFSIYALTTAFGSASLGRILGLHKNTDLAATVFVSYLPWLWTYTCNFWSVLHNQYMLIVAPYWSLAIEEQFYLVWPVLVFCLPRRGIFWSSVALILVSVLWRCIATAAGMGDIAIFTATLAQVNALGIGAVMAVLVRDKQMRSLMAKVSLPALEILGLAMGFAVAAIWLFNFEWLAVRPGVTLLEIPSGNTIEIPQWSNAVLNSLLWTVVALFYGALLSLALFSGEKRGLLGQLMSSYLMTWCGRYSYGIYIIHMPVMFVVSDLISFVGRTPRLSWVTNVPSVPMMISAVLTFGIAYLSYNLFEKKFLALKHFFPD